MKKNIRLNKKGFTLMELMVVIAIIVLLAGIMMPNLAKRIERAKMTKAEADIATMESAIAMYETDMGRYPDDNYSGLLGIQSLEVRLTGRDSSGTVSSITDDPDWNGPYIKGIEDDPWDQPYVYIKNSDPRGSPVSGTDYPAVDYGGSVNAPDNMYYYIYSTGKNRDTGTEALAKDDINNWDVDKTWEDAY